MIPYPLILRFIRRGLWIILFCGAVATLLGFYFSSNQTPVYRSTASFIVGPSIGSEEPLDFGDVVYGIDALSRRNTVATYAEVFGSNRVFDQAAESLNIPGELKSEYIHNAVVLPETSIIRVTAEGPDPIMTTELVTVMSNQATMIMQTLYSAYEITELDIAKAPELPLRPNPIQDAILAGVIGLLLGITIAIIRTPEIVTGRPDEFLASRGIAGNIHIDPISVYKMRQRSTPVEPTGSPNGSVEHGAERGRVIH